MKELADVLWEMNPTMAPVRVAGYWHDYLEARRPGLGKYLRDITRFATYPYA